MNAIYMTDATKPGGSIDTGNGWVPIKDFRGTFDGNGHYIKGMHIYGKTESDESYGFFSRVTGTVKQLGMLDVNIDLESEGEDEWATENHIGGITGGLDGKVEQCFVSGNIKFVSNNSGNGAHIDCVGGIAGTEEEAWEAAVINCYNRAQIDAYKKDGSTITNTAGIANDISVSNCYNLGTVNKGEGYAIGGYGDYEEACFYLLGTGKESSDYNVPLTDTQMKNKNYYTNFDFNTVWDIDPYHNYLYPQLRNCPQVRIKQLSIVKQPDQLVYNQGDKISLSGGEVQITYEDGFQATVSMDDSMLGTYDMMQLGAQNIALSKSGASDSFSITVNEIPVSAVTMSKTELVMEKGDTEDLTAAISPENATKKDVEWSSSNDSVVTVDQRGKVRAVSLGEAVVTAKSANGVEGKCEISVIIPCNSIKITNKGSYSYTEGTYVTQINAGSTHTFKYELNPVGSTEKVKWTSADPAIATVDGNGTVTGIKAGTTRITAETQTGQKDSVCVTIKAVSKKKKVILGKAKIKSIKASRKKLTVKWAKVKKADYYEVQFATNRSFTKGKDSYEEWGTKMTFKGKRKKTYFVRVRAVSESYDKTVRGKWSAVKKKKTK